MRRTMVLALGAVVGVTGCYNPYDYDYGYDDDTFVGDYRSPTGGTVVWENLDGELGGHTLSLAAVPGSTYGGGASTSFELIDERSGTWALFRLDVGADLYDAGLPEGAVLTSGTTDVGFMGCTGPEPYQYDYDGYADQVELTVRAGAASNVRYVDVVATFNDGGNRVVRGTLQLDLDDAPSATYDDYYDGWADDTRVPAPADGSGTWTEISTDLGPQALTTTEAAGSFVSGPSYSEIAIDTMVDGRWMMFRLTSGLDLAGSDIPVGAVLTSATDPTLDMLGCVGPAPGSYDFDGHTSDVELQVLAGEGPNDRLARIRATFVNEGVTQSITGTFRYRTAL